MAAVCLCKTLKATAVFFLHPCCVWELLQFECFVVSVGASRKVSFVSRPWEHSQIAAWLGLNRHLRVGVVTWRFVTCWFDVLLQETSTVRRRLTSSVLCTLSQRILMICFECTPSSSLWWIGMLLGPWRDRVVCSSCYLFCSQNTRRVQKRTELLL
jgi:hypothetical protein